MMRRIIYICATMFQRYGLGLSGMIRSDWGHSRGGQPMFATAVSLLSAFRTRVETS